MPMSPSTSKAEPLSNAKRRWAHTAHAIMFLKRCEKGMYSSKEEVDEEGQPLLTPRSDEVRNTSLLPQYNPDMMNNSFIRRLTFMDQVTMSLCDNQLNLLLLLLPLAIVSDWMEWDHAFTFALSFGSLIPLAALLGDFTENIAQHSNEAMGALLNATFGNATEMIISFFALKRGLFDIIKMSLIGSILGNMMLVLGCSFMAAGYRRKETKYNTKAAGTYMSLLTLASMGVVLPTTFKNIISVPTEAMLGVSREISIALIVVYVMYLVFQIKTHGDLFQDDVEDDEDEEDEPPYTMFFSCLGLAVATVFIAIVSEFLVDSLEPAAKSMGISNGFMGIILLPIVGNAAEHATAVVMAWNGRMNIAMGVAIGSSIQISLCVIPAMVLLAWAMGLDFDLDYHILAVTIMFLSVIVTTTLVRAGSTNWLHGAMLLTAYFIISCLYWHAPDSMTINQRNPYDSTPDKKK